jgi:hypothetical protein
MGGVVRDIVRSIEDGAEDFGLETLDALNMWVKNELERIILLPLSLSLFPTIPVPYLKTTSTLRNKLLDIDLLTFAFKCERILILYFLLFVYRSPVRERLP